MSATFETCHLYLVRGEVAVINYAANFPFAAALVRAFFEAF